MILKEKIVTTEAKAKQLKQEIERLVSRSKKLDLTTRRRLLSFLHEKSAAEKLFERIVPQFQERVGGYVRVIKLPARRGDRAPMARVEFVEAIKEQVEAVKKVKTVKSVKKTAKRPARKAKEKNARNQSNKGKRS